MRRIPAVIIVLVYSLFLISTNTIAEEGMDMQVKSTAFEENGLIPRKYTCDGADVSPPLRWLKPPAGTKSIALMASRT